MQIAVNSSQSAQGTGDISTTVTIPDTPYRTLAVFGGVTIPKMSLTAFTSGTFNGEAMDYLGYARNSSPNGDYYYGQAVSAFVMQQPPVGSYTLRIAGPSSSYYTALRAVILTSTTLNDGELIVEMQKATTTKVTVATTKPNGVVLFCSGCYNSMYTSPLVGSSVGNFYTSNGGTNLSRWYVGVTETDGESVEVGWSYSSISRPSTIGISLNPIYLGANFRAIII